MKSLNYQKIQVVFFGIVLAIVLISCGSKSAAPAEQVAVVMPAEQETVMDLSAGKSVYESTCQACHQASGLGLPPVFPPLAGSDYLLENKERAIKTAIVGSKSPITVNGMVYNGGAMILPNPLTDQQVVDVLNYILNSWGNDGGTVDMDEVKKVRAEL